MLHKTNVKLPIYEVEMSNVKGDFRFYTEVSRVDKPELLSLPNPKYAKIIVILKTW